MSRRLADDKTDEVSMSQGIIAALCDENGIMPRLLIHHFVVPLPSQGKAKCSRVMQWKWRNDIGSSKPLPYRRKIIFIMKMRTAYTVGERLGAPENNVIRYDLRYLSCKQTLANL